MALERLRDTLVRALATALRANGIDAVLDQWDLSPVQDRRLRGWTHTDCRCQLPTAATRGNATHAARPVPRWLSRRPIPVAVFGVHTTRTASRAGMGMADIVCLIDAYEA